MDLIEAIDSLAARIAADLRRSEQTKKQDPEREMQAQDGEVGEDTCRLSEGNKMTPVIQTRCVLLSYTPFPFGQFESVSFRPVTISRVM